MKIALKKQFGALSPYSEADMEKLSSLSDAVYEMDIKNLDMRTVRQNRALHLWCTKIAKVLNENNLYMTGIFGNKIEWTMDKVKLNIIKATISQVFGVDSTTKLKRKEIDEMIDYVTIAIAKLGVEIPSFPSKELWNERH